MRVNTRVVHAVVFEVRLFTVKQADRFEEYVRSHQFAHAVKRDDMLVSYTCLNMQDGSKIAKEFQINPEATPTPVSIASTVVDVEDIERRVAQLKKAKPAPKTDEDDLFESARKQDTPTDIVISPEGIAAIEDEDHFSVGNE